MQNISQVEIDRIKKIHYTLWEGDIFDLKSIKKSKIDFQDWVWLVFLISSGQIDADFGEGYANPKPFVLSLSCPSEGGLAVIHPDHMPDKFQNDIEKIKYVFEKLSLKSKSK